MDKYIIVATEDESEYHIGIWNDSLQTYLDATNIGYETFDEAVDELELLEQSENIIKGVRKMDGLTIIILGSVIILALYLYSLIRNEPRR